MNKIIILLLFCGVLIISFSQQKKSDPLQDFQAAERAFLKAETYSASPGYNETEEERLYLAALAEYEKLIPLLKGYDSLLFHACSKAGLLFYYVDSLEESKSFYGLAIRLKEKLPSLPDSFLFKPFLYTGGIYYTQNLFDSAFTVYKKAEEIQDEYPFPLEESQRLFNRLGVMYYETGNYRLAKNYFEKAIAVLNKTTPGDIALLINYKINIASLLVKLEEYEEARKLYQDILPYGQYINEIYHNLGIIELKQKKFPAALADLKKVYYGESKKNIDLFYNLAVAYGGLGKKDSADHYLAKAMEQNQKWNGSRKNVPYGLVLEHNAEELIRQKKLPEALANYQQAIIQFHMHFNNENVYSNPEEFSGIFSYLNLFNALAGKADLFVLLYAQSRELKQLKAALDAYRASFKLSAYVERTFGSDEARLFLNKLKYTVHNEPIEISLRLYELTKDNSYLEEAYFFDQQNKASTLALNMQENRVKKTVLSSAELFEEETTVKDAIARLSLRSSQVTDSVELNKLYEAIRDMEIRLSRIQEKLQNDPLYRERHSIQYIPPVKELYRLLDKESAIVSYHLSQTQLLALTITNTKLHYHKTPVDDKFFRLIDSLKVSLQSEGEVRFNGSKVSQDLYGLLITPILPELKDASRLIIIPDDELHYLPFEVLLDKNRDYLLKNYSVQYQYSTFILTLANQDNKPESQVAFAPFTSKGFTDSIGNKYNALPASAEEIKDLEGKAFIDEMATKKNFIDNAGHYGLIHLATHASVNNEQPMQSYIAFSPANNQPDYRLYAEEIYRMNLDSSDLVILSACETGSGQLIKGEGLMSLSRAFAYAGCPNIITSLWKAEDKTTAYIIRRLHHYLQKGLSKDRALQKAKLDLLEDKSLDPRYRSPRFWAHLIFIGSYAPDQKTSGWIWIAGGVVVLALLFYFFISRGEIEKRRRQM
jgi:CHAT domain-containing protein